MYSITPGVDQIEQSVDDWIAELNKYSMTQLLAQSTASSWSLGQLYMHIIEATRFFIRQSQAAASNNDNIEAEAYIDAINMFANDEFPDVRLPGPPSNAHTSQPENKEQLYTALEGLKKDLFHTRELVRQTAFKGKTKHFGLGYFTAHQWLQFAEMHLRHHQRQRKRLETFLSQNNIN